MKMMKAVVFKAVDERRHVSAHCQQTAPAAWRNTTSFPATGPRPPFFSFNLTHPYFSDQSLLLFRRRQTPS